MTDDRPLIPDEWKDLPKEYEIEWSERSNQYRALLGKKPQSYKGLPAIVEYHMGDKTKISGLGWCEKSRYHRLDGPAIIRYYLDGQIRVEIWAQNNMRHRLEDPAIIHYTNQGAIEERQFWVKDRKFDPGPLQETLWNLRDLV